MSERPEPLAPLTGKQRLFVEHYCGGASSNGTKAAQMAGYRGDARTLRAVGAENLAKPSILAAIREWRDAIRQEGVSVLECRLRRLNEDWQRLQDIVEARGVEMAGQCAGGETGLLVRQERVIGSGPGQEKITEYVLDTGLLRELRELEEQAAKELGQWKDPKGTGTPENPIQVEHRVSVDDLVTEGLRVLVETIKEQRAGARAGAGEDADGRDIEDGVPGALCGCRG